MSDAAAQAAQAKADEGFRHDSYDPHGDWQFCEEHDHNFLTYCVLCPEGTGNGKYIPAPLAIEPGDELPF